MIQCEILNCFVQQLAFYGLTVFGIYCCGDHALAGKATVNKIEIVSDSLHTFLPLPHRSLLAFKIVCNTYFMFYSQGKVNSRS